MDEFSKEAFEQNHFLPGSKHCTGEMEQKGVILNEAMYDAVQCSGCGLWASKCANYEEGRCSNKTHRQPTK